MNKKFRFVAFIAYTLCLVAIFCNKFAIFADLSWKAYRILGLITSIICLTSAIKWLEEPINRIRKHRRIEVSINFLFLLTEILIVILINDRFCSAYHTIILQNVVPLLTVSVNQESLIAQKLAFPLKFYWNTLIVGPIMEESIFRYLPKKFISNKKVFLVVSSLLFAIPHVIDTPNWILYLPLYMIPSVYLGYKYWKTDNILLNIFIHFMFNLVEIR